MASNRTRTVLAAAVLTGLALAGCERGSGGATTTVIQQSPAGGASATASAAKPTVTPISDPKELCHQARSLSRKLFVSTDQYWKLAVNAHGKSVTDPEISAAADKVVKTAKDVLPKFDGLVGPDAPADVAGAVRNFVASAKDFTDAVEEGDSDRGMDAIASKYGTAMDNLDSVCKASG